MPTATAPRTAPDLAQWVESFLLARRAEGRAPRTLESYQDDLREFTAFCAGRNVQTVEALESAAIREYLVHLGEHLASTTVVKKFRSLRVFLNWWGAEAAAPAWHNPMAKIKPPRVDLPPLPPAAPAVVQALIADCHSGRNASRDRAILLVLADVGLRASELCALKLADFDQATGALVVSKSKNRKMRTVYLGKKARVAVRAYIRDKRGGAPGALFLSQESRKPDGGLAFEGLRAVIRQHATRAGVKPPPLHAFRRAAALALHRNGADLLTIARILGHSNLSVLDRYIKQTGEDLRAAAERFSPADRL